MQVITVNSMDLFLRKIFLITLRQKVDIKPSSINLYTAIKKIGIYDINVKLHAEVTCALKINVATSEENATKQKDELNKPKESKQSEKNEVNKKTANN